MGILEELRDEISTRYPGRHFIRKVHSRILTGKTPHPMTREGWHLYLAGWGQIPPVGKAAVSDWPWIERYLRLRNPSGWDDVKNPGALESLIASPLPKGYPTELKEEWYVQLGLKARARGEWLLAAKAIRLAARLAPHGRVEKYMEFTRLYHFIAGSRKPGRP